MLVVRNLFSNAVTYSNAGGWVRIATLQDPESVTLSVINSGSTVPREQADEVFKRFCAAMWCSNVGVNFGLGLSLAKKIVTALGGSICAKSEAGGEFEITVLIPSRDNGPDSIPSTIATFERSGRQLSLALVRRACIYLG